jgi:hypothetical protein
LPPQLSSGPLASQKEESLMKNLAIILISSLLVLVSCKDNSTSPNNGEASGADVAQFIKSQNLPNSGNGEPVYLVNLTSQKFSYFMISYGVVHDPVAGGFTSSAYGIKHNNSIGWIQVNDYEGDDQSKFIFYQLDSTDTLLFSQILWEQIESHGDINVYFSFLANNIHTPSSALMGIVQFLYTYVNPDIGFDLLENPNVQSNVGVLTLLANLPATIEPGIDIYSGIRKQANTLLQSLGH